MIFNLGILAQVLGRGYAGYGRGQIEAENRRIEEEERKRRAAHEALVDSILQSREGREASDWTHTQTRRPILEAREDETHTYTTGRRKVEDTQKDRRAAADAARVEAETADIGTDNAREDRKERAEARLRAARAKYYESGRGRSTSNDPAAKKRDYLLKRVPELKKPGRVWDPIEQEYVATPGLPTREAVQQALEEWNATEQGGSPTAQSAGRDPDDVIRRYVRSQGGVMADTAPPTLDLDVDEPEIIQENPPAGESIDDLERQEQMAQRWEMYVNAGLSERAATERVLREFGE